MFHHHLVRIFLDVFPTTLCKQIQGEIIMEILAAQKQQLSGLGESGILFDKQVDQRGIWRRQGSIPTHASICRRHEGEESEKEYWELCGVWCKDQNLDFPPRPGAEYHPCNFAGTYDSSTLRRLLYDRDVLLRSSQQRPCARSLEHEPQCAF